MSREGFHRGRRYRPSDSSTSWRHNKSNFAGKPRKSQPDSTSCTSMLEQKPEHGEEPLNVPSIIGTCPDMCPARERAQREKLRDLSVFERLSSDPRRTSPDLAVKKFCRTMSAVNLEPSDIRPPNVLLDTLKYLMKLADSSEHPYEVVHDFVFDRTRSIRQDLAMQNINTELAIHMYEQMVIFYVISPHKLARCHNRSNNQSLLHLNKEQLMKSLMSLYALYKINHAATSTTKNDAEFYSFFVLLHLGSKTRLVEESLLFWFQQVAFHVLKSKEMCFARNILRHFRAGNYIRFFRMVAAEASYLQFCLIEPVINEVRAQALSYINQSGYKLHPYPLAHLSKLLMMQESELEAFCISCSLEIKTDDAGMKSLPTKQTSFCIPKEGLHPYSFSGSPKFKRQESCDKHADEASAKTGPAKTL